MQRRSVTLFFVLLLLFMQQAEHSHALGHIGEWFQEPHDRALTLPHSELPCGLCALFAGGSTAAIDGAASIPAAFVGFAIPALAVISRPVPAPSYYASRAPPAFL